MRDFWRGKVSPRELLNEVRFLPTDSALVRALAPDAAELGEYRPGDYVLMAIYDATVGKAGAYPRPAEVQAERREKQQLMALLEAQAARNRARDEAEGVA